MKFKLDIRGILIISILEPFTEHDCMVMVEAVEKFLHHGTKLIFSFSKEAANSPFGFDHIEKKLQAHRGKSKQSGGEICYVLPPEAHKNIPGTVEATIEQAVKALGGTIEHLNSLKAENEKLHEANKVLTDRLGAALKLIKAPQTNDELNSALAHYKILAGDSE